MKRPKEQLFVFALLFMACKFIYGPMWDVIVLPHAPKAITIAAPKPPAIQHFKTKGTKPCLKKN